MYDSDPKAPETDARQNSWATGDDPEVNSIYLRLLAPNPAVRGHNTNLAVAGLRKQAALEWRVLALDR